MILAAQKRKML